MLDNLFSKDSPGWVDILFDNLSKEITIDLAAGSEYFAELKEKMEQICKEYPEFIKIIENEEVQEDVLLSAESAKKLTELIQIEFEILDIYQRLLYVRGCRDGIQFAGYAGIIKDI